MAAGKGPSEKGPESALASLFDLMYGRRLAVGLAPTLSGPSEHELSTKVDIAAVRLLWVGTVKAKALKQII
jgi:hypothetical protein